MSTYVIGDVQGCFLELMELLKLISFNRNNDTLWFAGDLVNRGPNSLKVLEFVYELPKYKIVLGNHDLHLLECSYNNEQISKKDTFQDILLSPKCDLLCEWLRHQPLMYHDQNSSFILVHAGIHPKWDLKTALALSKEVETLLKGGNPNDLLKHLHDNNYKSLDNVLKHIDKLRLILYYFTMMRFCDIDGELEFKIKNSATSPSDTFFPWFKVPNRKLKNHPIVFGHWAALEGKTHEHNCFALDTGCVWGNKLTAMRIEDQKIFIVKSKVSIPRS